MDPMLDEVIQWGCEYLLSQGLVLKSNQPEVVQDKPWSYVVRFVTADGFIYLKHTPRLIALEAEITQILYDQFHAEVPDIIAHNKELDCFLMKDAGRPLRDVLKNKFSAELLCKAIQQFTAIQLNVSDHLDIFLNIGVPDWRLDKIPDLFDKFLDQKDILMKDGLSENEISELKNLLPKITDLCQKLSGYSIKPSIVQPDFHDNNLLIDEISQKITLIDLGEITISHPFFSLITCLYQVKKHHGLADNDKAYQQIIDACLQNFINMESKENLLEAFLLAQILWYVYGALAGDRLLKACGAEKLMQFQPGRLVVDLKKLVIITR
jgi:hypothetical protein